MWLHIRAVVTLVWCRPADLFQPRGLSERRWQCWGKSDKKQHSGWWSPAAPLDFSRSGCSCSTCQKRPLLVREIKGRTWQKQRQRSSCVAHLSSAVRIVVRRKRPQVAALSRQMGTISRHFWVLLFSEPTVLWSEWLFQPLDDQAGHFLSFSNHLFACDSPRISPTPMQMPEMPIRLFASWPNCVMAPMHVPYTPL